MSKKLDIKKLLSENNFTKLFDTQYFNGFIVSISGTQTHFYVNAELMGTRIDASAHYYINTYDFTSLNKVKITGNESFSSKMYGTISSEFKNISYDNLYKLLTRYSKYSTESVDSTEVYDSIARLIGEDPDEPIYGKRMINHSIAELILTFNKFPVNSTEVDDSLINFSESYSNGYKLGFSNCTKDTIDIFDKYYLNFNNINKYEFLLGINNGKIKAIAKGNV